MTNLDERVRSHPQYPALLLRVARAEAALGGGRWASRMRYFMRNGRGLYLGGAGARLGLRSGLEAWGEANDRASAVASRMLPEIFADPWPGGDSEMIAALYNVARADVAARRRAGITRLR